MYVLGINTAVICSAYPGRFGIHVRSTDKTIRLAGTDRNRSVKIDTEASKKKIKANSEATCKSEM